jgi:hypothetical protein
MARQPCAPIAKRDPVDQAVQALARLLGQAAARALPPEPAADPDHRTHEDLHAERHDPDPAQEEAAAEL